MDTVRSCVGDKVTNFITMAGRAIGCVVLAMVSAWKFSIVILAVVPVIATCMSCIVILTKKYIIKEMKSYGLAGTIAQETLSSLRTVLSLNMQKIQVKKYEEGLALAESMGIKKGLVAGVTVGALLSTMHFLYAIGVLYATYLIRTECDVYPPGIIMQSFFCMITAAFAFGEIGPFFGSLAEGKG
jgi:ATP-binding cassette subfamily B (MDR/TAP) protein 1